MSTRLRPIGAPGDLVEGIEFSGTSPRQRSAPRERRGGIVESIGSDSAAGALGIRPGNTILSINGHRLRDVVDYQYYSSDAVLTLEVLKPGAAHPETLSLVHEPGEPLRITFTQPTFAPIRECNNHCPFCFIDQLPAEMRSSLYIRDDDYRYSFLYGNFVTLTNLNEKDWSRLGEQRLSPLYVSVHATDPKLRRLLLGNNRAPDIRAQLRRLFDMGIQVHTQVVVCPGINDGDALKETVSDLVSSYPNVQSVGIVPVGLTRTPAEILAGPAASCSRILPSAADLPLHTFRPDEAKRIVSQARSWQRFCRQASGKSIVYASDEFYLLSGGSVPAASWYDGYPQYENGIGMVRDLLDDWGKTRRRLRSGPSRPSRLRISLVCGEMIAPALDRLVNEWRRLRGIQAHLVVLPNGFFGPRVKVSGLLTGRDIIANKDKLQGDLVILPEVMLDKTGKRLLDNFTPDELQSAIGKPIQFAGMMSAVDKLVSAA